MTLAWEGGEEDRQAAIRAAEARHRLLDRSIGDTITIANEFSEIKITRVETRNGSRVLVESPKSGQWIALDPMQLEALTWQTPRTFSAMIANPFAPMVIAASEIDG